MRISDTWKRILSVVTLIAFVAAGMAILGHLLTPISYSTYFNHDMEEIRKSGSGVDMIFVGASRGQKALIPSVFEEEMGLGTVVNATSSAQMISGSYYRAKELMAEYSPKYVLLDLSVKSILKRSSPVQSVLVASDSMGLINRISMITREMKPENWAYLFNAYRFRDNLLKIPELAEKRAELIERDYTANAETADDYYADTGWVNSPKGYEQGNIPVELDKYNFKEKNIDPEKLAYLDGIREMCEKKGATLILVSIPTSMMYNFSDSDFQKATDWYTAYAEKYGIPYYNLNLLKDREKILPDTCMKDEKHVNADGAEVVSEKLCEILNSWIAGEDTDGYFYGGYTEMLADCHRVAGISATAKKDDDNKKKIHINITSVQHPDATPIYRVLYSDDEWETETVLADWTEEQKFDVKVPKRSGYRMRIEAALSPDDPDPAWIEKEK